MRECVYYFERMPRYSKKLLTFFLMGWSIVVIGQDNSADYSNLVERVRPAVVSVHVFDARGNTLRQGTGFLVGEGLIVTNHHVIEGGSRIIVRTAGKGDYEARVETAQSTADLALLTSEVDGKMEPLKFSRTSPRIGERIVVIGSPLGLSGTVSDGIVSAFRPSSAHGSLIQITAPISEGSSGSPVVNLKGDVVGVATLNLPRGQNLNFAISSDYIQSIWSGKISTSKITSATTTLKSRWRPLISKDITYDIETLSTKKSVVSVWIRYEETDGSSSKHLMELNCLRNQLREVHSISYLPGGDVRRQNETVGKWNSSIPGSNGETYFKIFCEDQPDYQYLIDEGKRRDLIEKGAALEEANRFDEAIAVFTELIVNFESDAGYGFARIGAIRLEQQRFSEAKNALSEAIKLEPKDSYYRDLLGQVYEKQNQLNLAKEAFWESLRLEKDSYMSAQYQLIELYRKGNDLSGELKVYLFLISKGQRTVFNETGNTYDKLGQKVQARAIRLRGVALLQSVVQNGQAKLLDFYELSSIYRSLDQPSKEKATLILGLKRFPDDGLLLRRLADTYNRAKEWQEAIRTVEIGLRLAKENFERRSLLRVLKATYEGLGQKEEAAKVDSQLREMDEVKLPTILN